jgi:ABC-type multidrug transport system permease subunit
VRVTFQFCNLLLRCNIPYSHGVVPRACEEEGGDGQQLQNMNRNPVHKYTNTQNKHKIVTNTKAVQKLNMIQTHDNRDIIIIIIIIVIIIIINIIIITIKTLL